MLPTRTDVPRGRGAERHVVNSVRSRRRRAVGAAQSSSRYDPRMRGTAALSAIIITAATVVGGAACSSVKPPEPTAPTGEASSSTSAAPIGTQVGVAGEKMTITSGDSTAAYTVDNLQPVPPNASVLPAKGTMYAVDITIAAETGTTAVNGFWFVARTANGDTIAPTVGAVNPGITSGQLPAGQRLAAHLAFDVPAGEAIVQITLRDPKGKPLAAWSFA
ncbi:MAG: DUF1942 domain-containing protein [Mycobacterium sp.]|nr:MAG: DUF1942 domain-containing protein [Mycobacterium sp.]